ncbi:MAG: hypothetical protein WCD70_11395 [Alphaproteobacteria bacterium]
MWPISGKKEVQTFSCSTVSDEILLSEAQRLSSKITKGPEWDTEWESKQPKNIDGLIDKGRLQAHNKLCLRDETTLLDIVDEMRSRGNKTGFEQTIFAPLKTLLTESHSLLTKEYVDFFDRPDKSDPNSLDVHARHYAREISKIDFSPATPERPTPSARELQTLIHT